MLYIFVDTLEFESAENLEIIACMFTARIQLYNKLIELFKKYRTKNSRKINLIENLTAYNCNTLIDNFLWDYRYTNNESLMTDTLLHNARNVYY